MNDLVSRFSHEALIDSRKFSMLLDQQHKEIEIDLTDQEALYSLINKAEDFAQYARLPYSEKESLLLDFRTNKINESEYFIQTNFAQELLPRFMDLAHSIPDHLLSLLRGEVKKMLYLLITQLSLFIAILIIIQIVVSSVFNEISGSYSVFCLMGEEEISKCISSVEDFQRLYENDLGLAKRVDKPTEKDHDDAESWEKVAAYQQNGAMAQARDQKNSVIKVGGVKMIDTPLRKKRHGVVLKGKALPNTMQMVDFRKTGKKKSSKAKENNSGSKERVTNVFKGPNQELDNSFKNKGTTLFTDPHQMAESEEDFEEPRFARFEKTKSSFRYYYVKWMKRMVTSLFLLLGYQIFVLIMSLKLNSDVNKEVSFIQMNYRILANAEHTVTLLAQNLISITPILGRTSLKENKGKDILLEILAMQGDQISELSSISESHLPKYLRNFFSSYLKFHSDDLCPLIRDNEDVSECSIGNK